MRILWGDLRMLIKYADKEGLPDEYACEVVTTDDPVATLRTTFEDAESRECVIVISSAFLKARVKFRISMDLDTRLEEK